MRITMEDVAQHSGTSVGVVSVVLNGAKSKTLRVSDEKREAVLKAASELGYRRNLTASSLVTGKSRIIGLMLPAVDVFRGPDPYYSTVTAGFSAVAAERGYDVMFFTAASKDDEKRTTKILERGVDGVLLMMTEPSSHVAQELTRNGVATVSVSSEPGITAATVNVDEEKGARLATEHLIKLGHRRIAHHLGNPAIYTTEQRRLGFVRTLAAYGLRNLYATEQTSDFSRASGYQTAIQLLNLPREERPTAIFAANDLSAHGILDAAEELGIDVPTELSVVGYDNTWYSSLPTPKLTTIDAEVERQARFSAQVLIDQIEGNSYPVLTVLTPTLVKGESSTQAS